MDTQGNNITSGKHLICDIKGIQNKILLNCLPKIGELLDHICEKYEFTVLNRVHHIFEPQGLTLLYLLSESHISIHTFPEHEYIALDIYTCRQYEDNKVYMEIFDMIIRAFDAPIEKNTPIILDRNY